MTAACLRTLPVLLPLLATGLLALPAHAVVPVVRTVPWVAANATIPHTTYPGKAVRLKGTADQQGANFQYTWDFGDGSPVASGSVGNRYAIEASHVYVGSAGQVWTAQLRVTDLGTGESAVRPYFVQMKPRTLETETNVAIDEGLWALHKQQNRFSSGGLELGDWTTTLGYYGLSAANLNAFEVNGHLETGGADNPYTETVARGMRRLFQFLRTTSLATQTNGLGTFNPDTNGNGIGAGVNQSYEFYQGGMFIDAIVASGTPDAIAPSGPANVIGRRYRDIVQDMVDYFAYCQYDNAPYGGGWRYSCNDFPDNSAAQWGAIGLIAAERHFGATVPPIVKSWNRWWLSYTQHPQGSFGYTDTNTVWGPYATTPSGMVQMVMDGIGRDNVPGARDPRWNAAETFIRDHFGDGGTALTNIKAYYYGLFSFTKAMLLHDANGDGIADPITLLRSSTAGVTPIDWYAAETARGDPTNGVARTLVDDQGASGLWSGHVVDGTQSPFETAWAIMMLHRTVFASGAPVAVARPIPNPAVAGQVITLDGADSFHQDAARRIDSWQWDFNGDGIWDATGPQVTRSFALGLWPVTLRVTDDGAPEQAATTTVIVQVTIPPLAPTADANGPYHFCPQTLNWFLDGTRSVNPDQGQSEPGRPGDTIQSYAWDLNGDGQFNDATGAQPSVKGYFQTLGSGSYLVQLKVTDTTQTSYPSSGLPNLESLSAATVFVHDAGDPACSCIADLAARAKSGKIQLTWLPVPGTAHYNVYRGAVSGGPYLKIASTPSTYATWLDATVANGIRYHYVVRRAELNGDELCQSNQASATATAR